MKVSNFDLYFLLEGKPSDIDYKHFSGKLRKKKKSVYQILFQILYDPDIFKQKADPLETLELIKGRVEGVVEAIKKIEEN